LAPAERFVTLGKLGFRHCARWRQRATAAAGRLLAVGCLLVTLGLPAWGQCAMCREAAASQNAEGVKALNRGIILLAIPPVAILVGIGCVTYRYRNSYRGQGSETYPDE